MLVERYQVYGKASPGGAGRAGSLNEALFSLLGSLHGEKGAVKLGLAVLASQGVCALQSIVTNLHLLFPVVTKEEWCKNHLGSGNLRKELEVNI